jgi:hypothetical protein
MTGTNRPQSAKGFHDRYPGSDVELAHAGINAFLKSD